MNEEEIKVITDSLSQKYVLISRTKFLTFLGGFFAFLVAAGFLTYQTVLNAINSTGAKSTIAEINQFRDQAKSGAKRIDELLESFSKHPTSVLYAESTRKFETSSNQFVDIPDLYLKLPPGNAIRKFALVALNVPSPYARGNNYPGTEFAITNARGDVFASGVFTYASKAPSSPGRQPFTLIVRIPLNSDKPTEVKAQWRSVRNSSCNIDSFSSISAILE